ncbi:MAG: hypothetical protein R3261_07125, partial [Alphaproteobacteria bacterium]|nr:hypothetical protein [Alphaproteobacteria bacterium]
DLQIEELWRMHPLPHMSLDGDEAGQKAAARAAERAIPILKPGKSFSFVFMPEGEDPDSLILAGGPKVFQAALDSAMPLDEFIWQQELKKSPFKTPEQKADLERRLMELVEEIPDETVKKHYRSGFNNRLWQAIKQASSKKSTPYFRPAQKRFNQSSAPHAYSPLGQSLRQETAGLSRRQQQIVLATLINHPALIDHFEERLDYFTFDTDLDKLREGLQKIISYVEVLDADIVQTHLVNDGMQTLLDLVLTEQVYSLAKQARKDAEEQDARVLLDHMLKIRAQEELAGELGRRNHVVGDDISTKETRIFAMRKDLDQVDFQIGEDGEE